MRALLLLLGLLAALLVEHPVQGYGWTNQSVVIGQPSYFDRLLLQDRAVLGPKQGQSVVYNLQYPSASARSQGERITSIKIIDQWLNGTNGNVFVNGGGVGQTFVSLSIRSSLSRGMSYLVYIYGRKY